MKTFKESLLNNIDGQLEDQSPLYIDLLNNINKLNNEYTSKHGVDILRQKIQVGDVVITSGRATPNLDDDTIALGLVMHLSPNKQTAYVVFDVDDYKQYLETKDDEYLSECYVCDVFVVKNFTKEQLINLK